MSQHGICHIYIPMGIQLLALWHAGCCVADVKFTDIGQVQFGPNFTIVREAQEEPYATKLGV